MYSIQHEGVDHDNDDSDDQNQDTDSDHNNDDSDDQNQDTDSDSLPTYEQAPSYSPPKNIGLPYTYNWNGYDGLPTKTDENSLTWSNFPAGEATAFPITSVDAATLNNPDPIDGEEVPRPQDINGNPVDLTTITTKDLDSPYTMAVSLVPKSTGPTPHIHWSDAEWFYVLSGALDLWVGSNEYGVGEIPGQDDQPLENDYYYVHVKAGQMVQGHPGMLHSFTNTQDEPAVWLTFWKRGQSQLSGGIEQFFTRGDISPFVTDYQASVDYTNSLPEEESNARKEHWGEVFPLYNVTISNSFGQYLTSQQSDPVYANQPGPDNPSVNYNIPLEAVQDNASDTLNGLLSSTPELEVSLDSRNGEVEVKNDADTTGVAINILFRVNQLSDNFSEVGYRIIDSADSGSDSSTISKPLFYTLDKDHPQPVEVNYNKNGQFETGQKLSFYVKDRDGVETSEDLSFSQSSDSSFTLDFSNGMSITGELNGAISSLQDVIGGTHLETSVPLLDTRTLASKTINIESTQSREAVFNSVASFYKIVDESGGVEDPITGNIIQPGDPQYQSVALDSANEVSGLTFSVDENHSSNTQSGTFAGGELYAPLIQVSNSELNSEFVYFAFESANVDNSQQIVSLGTNIFGFEDLPNGGDRDFDDLIVQANFSLTPQLSTIAPS